MYFKIMLTSFWKNFKVTYLNLNCDIATVYQEIDDDEILCRWITSRAIFDENHISSTPASPRTAWICRIYGSDGNDLDVWGKNERTKLRESLFRMFSSLHLQSAAKVSPIVFSRMLFRRHQVPPTCTCTDFLRIRNFCFVTFRMYVGKSHQKFLKYFLRMKSSSTAITKIILIYLYLLKKNIRW